MSVVLGMFWSVDICCSVEQNADLGHFMTTRDAITALLFLLQRCPIILFEAWNVGHRPKTDPLFHQSLLEAALAKDKDKAVVLKNGT